MGFAGGLFHAANAQKSGICLIFSRFGVLSRRGARRQATSRKMALEGFVTPRGVITFHFSAPARKVITDNFCQLSLLGVTEKRGRKRIRQATSRKMALGAHKPKNGFGGPQAVKWLWGAASRKMALGATSRKMALEVS